MKLLLAIGTLLLRPTVALGAIISVPQDVTLTLPVDGTTYLLTSDTHVDAITVNSTSFEFTMTAGNRVVVRSLTNRGLANTLNAPVTCNASSGSTVILEIPVDGATKTVTVTPSATCEGS